MVPSIGIEPMTFPMSRERATAAPTGLKLFIVSVFSSRNELDVTSIAPAGLKLISLRQNCLFIISYNAPGFQIRPET